MRAAGRMLLDLAARGEVFTEHGFNSITLDQMLWHPDGLDDSATADLLALLAHPNIRSKEASIETPLHIKAAQYMALLGIRSGDAPKYTVAQVARKCGVSPGTVYAAIHYSEITPEIRAAVDADKIALKLAITDRDCICYGFDAKGDRHLLSVEQQTAIWEKLCAAFAVEAADDGIRDNAHTRRALRGIKAEVLEGTGYVLNKPERADVARARAVADAVEAGGAVVAHAQVVARLHVHKARRRRAERAPLLRSRPVLTQQGHVTTRAAVLRPKSVESLVNDLLPFADGSVRRLVLQHALEQPRIPSAFLGECVRVLANGGELLVVGAEALLTLGQGSTPKIIS